MLADPIGRYRLDAEDEYTCKSWEKALTSSWKTHLQPTAKNVDSKLIGKHADKTRTPGGAIPQFVPDVSDESEGEGFYEEPADTDAEVRRLGNFSATKSMLGLYVGATKKDSV